jgi:hypothetical protein
MTAPSVPIEPGDIISQVRDGDEEWYDEDLYGLEGDMYHVDEITEGGVVECRKTLDTEWLDGRTVQFPIEWVGLVHSHEGRACANPLHGIDDGYVGYHRR